MKTLVESLRELSKDELIESYLKQGVRVLDLEREVEQLKSLEQTSKSKKMKMSQKEFIRKINEQDLY